MWHISWVSNEHFLYFPFECSIFHAMVSSPKNKASWCISLAIFIFCFIFPYHIFVSSGRYFLQDPSCESTCIISCGNIFLCHVLLSCSTYINYFTFHLCNLYYCVRIYQSCGMFSWFDLYITYTMVLFVFWYCAFIILYLDDSFSQIVSIIIISTSSSNESSRFSTMFLYSSGRMYSMWVIIYTSSVITPNLR